MASGYKLRLGDGTIFLVDDKGLATWLQGGLVDDKARVQPAGSKQWLTIRQLMIAVEKATREHEAKQKRLAEQRQVAEERAEAERRAAEEQAALDRLAEERLEAERIAAEEEAERERQAAQERLAAERRSARERAEAERRAAEEQAALDRLAEERLAAERLAAEERAERERRAAQERLAAERRSARERAAVQRRAAEEQAALDRVAEERLAAERLAAEELAERERQVARERLAAERRSARERAEAERRADQERAARARQESEAREAELDPLELEPLTEAELEEPVVSAADLGLVPVEWPVADERDEPLAPPAAREVRPPAPAPSFRLLEGRAPSLFESLMARWSRPAAAPRQALAAPPGEMPHALAVPPPSLRDLPVIPLAEVDEPTGADDEGQGNGLTRLWAAFLESRAGEIAPRLWVWFKRVTLTAALLVIAALLASHTSVWLPATTEVGIALFGQVDKVKERVAPSTLPPAAVAAIAAASEQLPHLRTETVELIMASRAHRALAPPQVFRLAGDAVERGRAALGPSSAAELDRLTEALTAELTRAERKRLAEYLQRVRAQAATAPFEDQEAVWLMARAARRLPPERLSRLQELLAHAVALGLQPAAPEPG